MPYGQIFQETVGRSVNTFSTIMDLEKAAELALGRPLPVQSIESPIVHRHGNIFRYTSGMLERLDQRIAHFLAVR